MIDESDYAGSEHSDPALVASYDQKQGRPDPTSDLEVLAAHGLSSTSIVVDLGAGTGTFALAAARRFGQVTAVDVSPAMLNVGRDRAHEAGYQNAGALVDGVYTRNGLHHLPDFGLCYDSSDSSCALCEVVAKACREPGLAELA